MNSHFQISIKYAKCGAHGSVVVEALCYKPEGRVFKTMRGRAFFNLSNLSSRTRPWVLLSLYQNWVTRIFLGSRARPAHKINNLIVYCVENANPRRLNIYRRPRPVSRIVLPLRLMFSYSGLISKGLATTVLSPPNIACFRMTGSLVSFLRRKLLCWVP
jgi:hypothetical protein